MKEIIYLTIDRYKVKKMTKTVPNTNRNEHILKLTVEVKPEAYRDPLVSKEIVVEDWREGIDISDVDFQNPFITQEEANTIRQMRLDSTIEILKSQGYKIEKEATNE